GGIIGILLGILGSYGVAQLGGWPFVVSPVAPIIAFAFSMGVGVFFGLYPAYKAAKLDPVESLSYE
ncbi:MAG: ABC transporter permease, partial [Bacillota bacterium]